MSQRAIKTKQKTKTKHRQKRQISKNDQKTKLEIGKNRIERLAKTPKKKKRKKEDFHQTEKKEGKK